MSKTAEEVVQGPFIQDKDSKTNGKFNLFMVLTFYNFLASDNIMAVVDVDARDVEQEDMSPRFQREEGTNKNDESISLTQYYLKGPV